MIPPVAEPEDPTTQVPWPTRTRVTSDAPSSTVVESNEVEDVAKGVLVPAKRRLSTWDLITLSISMAGAQIAWTVELGYGTPFLLGLGISEQLTSLVWLAGPISGLIAQPVIGAISDSSTSKYRRRYWIILSTVALVFSTLILAYCEALAGFLVDLFSLGNGIWDEKRNTYAKNTAIGLAIFSFYILDFALNALQASLRNLLLDIAPASQLNSGNAWHGRMTNAGNIIGFGFGFLPLAELPLIKLLGGSQFRKFCIICIVILVATVWITCYLHEEQERPAVANQRGQTKEVLENIKNAIFNLPRPIRRVCYVQLFAFMGWFPFLFYATTYVGQVMAEEIGREPDPELATRKGEFAMLIYSIVAVVSGTILPHLANRDRRLMAQQGDDDVDAELTRIRGMVRQWKIDAARQGKPLRLPVMPFLLRNIWTGALLLFTVLTMSTLFIHTVFQATIFISLIGICWSVAMWAPFAIIMELLKDLSTPPTIRPTHSRTLSVPVQTRRGSDERQPLLRRRRSFDAYDAEQEEVPPAARVAGGTILGVHNLAIVAPQLIVAIVTSIIFQTVDGNVPAEHGGEGTYFGKHGVGWVLRFGGAATLVGAMFARRVPPTPTEKAMRRRLGEMMVLREDSTP
ncbi:ANK-REP-REGION domain-containing protein [Mycena indigotica]|uniref:ANK-REP-REGION domain-containing protein n=1 Tax=Mycena indigotica TaxID=2126181 RepID=A0A8H6W3Q5_9AGAR|nr:ANK-REP-REGION domain-containing protein [Mycena indigotica]KAF7301801.1 ANK-REP-REGION domain-containing protein [Mycena indigotica]